MSFPEYPDYKGSRILWLDVIPCHWSTDRLKNLVRIIPSNVDKHSNPDEIPVFLCNYTDVYYRDRITSDLDFMRATVSADELERFRLRAEDVIITKDSETADDIAVPAYVPETLDSVVCGYHLSIVRPARNAFGRFLYYWFLSRQSRAYFEVSAKGLTRVGLSQGALGGAYIAAPHPTEQARIAQFLDHETARIDALIEEQQRLIDLLQEKRQAVISRAVTKGLDPDVPIKDSGVEWLEEVPAHWEVTKLAWCAKLQSGIAKGKSYDGGDVIAVPYLRVANVQDGYLDLSDLRDIEILRGDLERYKLQAGDVLMNEGGDNDKLGRGTVWPGDIEPCVHQNHVFAIRPNARLRSRWLALFTRTKPARSYFYLYSKQSTNLASISSTNILGCTIPLPPTIEQDEILRHLSDEEARINELESAAAKAIDLLIERRSALISAAVTGKIDVRGWKPQDTSVEHDLPKAAEAEAQYG